MCHVLSRVPRPASRILSRVPCLVHQDGQVGDVAHLHVADNRGENLFVGHALAHHEEVGVGVFHQQVGVGDDGHRKSQVLSD